MKIFKFLFFVSSLLSCSFLKGEDTFVYDYYQPLAFYYPNLNILYINVPKNGSSFMRFALQEPFILVNAYTFLEQNPNSIKLFVIRNPYSRIISSYFEVLKCREDGPGKTPQYDFYKEKENPVKSFLSFLNTLQTELIDPHCNPQYRFLSKKELTLNDIDCIIDFDHLNEDLKLFSEKYQIPINFELLEKNESPGDLKAILTEFVDSNEEVKALIQELYQEDFVLYKEAMEKRDLFRN